MNENEIIAKNKLLVGTIYEGKSDSIELIVSDRLEKSYRGTGDIFAPVLIGIMLDGKSLSKSTRKLCKFVEKCILKSNKYDYPAKKGILFEKVLKHLNN